MNTHSETRGPEAGQEAAGYEVAERKHRQEGTRVGKWERLGEWGAARQRLAACVLKGGKGALSERSDSAAAQADSVRAGAALRGHDWRRGF